MEKVATWIKNLTDRAGLSPLRGRGNIAYSCYVDSHPRFEWQATLFCASLIRNGRVDPGDIYVHINPGVSNQFRKLVEGFGANCVEAEPFDQTNPYCNKIVQTRTEALSKYQSVVLCDCDLYVLAPFSQTLGEDEALGRTVDRPNPPLQMLEEIYLKSSLAFPNVVPVGYPLSTDEKTFATNWNGGFYVLRGDRIGAFGEAWARFAQGLLGREEEALGDYKVHVDQVAFGMALDELKLSWSTLNPAHNVPTHLPVSEHAQFSKEVGSLHYHSMQDYLGRLMPSKEPSLNGAIAAASEQIEDLIRSRILADSNFAQVFEKWQAHCSEAGLKELEQAACAFREPRYLRHSARRLEHLASLHLDISGRSVLELGAGIGEHSQFFLDRGCSVFSVEPRDENVAFMRKRHSDDAEHLPGKNHFVLKASADEAVELLSGNKFEIVYNYGLLYHMANPREFLRASTGLCGGLYLLETAISDLVSMDTKYSEDQANLTNAIDGECVLLSREEIFSILQEEFRYAYVPRTQPAHEQFLKDWIRAPDINPGRHRAIFIGSLTPIESPLLSPVLLMEHE